MLWTCRSHRLETDRRTLVMGIVNITPDSFSDGGQFLDPGHAVEHALRLAGEGADMLDLGAESTRPGSKAVPPEEQIARLRPVMERLRASTNLPISIDTTSAAVAREMLALGADIINDISALRADDQMASVVAESGAGCVLMHMLGDPATMQQDPVYGDVVGEVRDFLRQRLQVAQQAGIQPECLVVDPGIGFGKTLQHNLTILNRLNDFHDLNRPLLMGVSRKSFIGKVLNVEVDDRLEGTLGAVAWCVMQGAQIVRVHDVRPVRRVVDMIQAISQTSAQGS